MSEFITPRERALQRIARSLSEHQSMKRVDGPFSTCRNQACHGVIFLTRMDTYSHQAVVLANDLQADLDFYLEFLREDAAEEGREITAEEIAEIRAEYLVLAPAPATEAAPKEAPVD